MLRTLYPPFSALPVIQSVSLNRAFLTFCTKKEIDVYVLDAEKCSFNRGAKDFLS